MASIIRSIHIDCDADGAWTRLRDFSLAAELFAGVLTHCEVQGDTRTVTFANGAQVVERLLGVDDVHHRLAYTVIRSFEHHSAAMEVQATPQGALFRWITDVLPDEAAARIAPLVDAGCAAVKRSLEQG